MLALLCSDRAATIDSGRADTVKARNAVPVTWGSLERGPYAVGFRLLDRYDFTRQYWMPRDLNGRLRTFERARPMRIGIWYPARSSTAPALSVGDYVALMGAEDRITSIGETERRNGERAIGGFPFFRPATAGQRTKFEALPAGAQREAPPADGRFPLILYSLGSAALAHVTPEYLASHGYVVVQMPRLGWYAGMPPDAPNDTDAKVHDTEFLLQAAHELPFADVHTVGVIGFSAGGRWALSIAMKDPDVRAVVSLDSVMLFGDAQSRDWKALPFYNLGAVRIPILHMIRRTWVPQEDPALWEGLRFSERTRFVFEDPVLDHFDFQSAGYETTLTGMRPEQAASVAAAFHIFNRYTLAFLDAHVKGDAAARALLGRPVQGLPTPGWLTVTHAEASAAPLTLADLVNAFADGSVEPALRELRQQLAAGRAIDVPETVVNLTAYNLLGGGRVQDAIALFELNLEAHPMSANAHDSLADGYVAAGQADRATELARKALALLDADSTTPPERRQAIRESILQKLKPR